MQKLEEEFADTIAKWQSQHAIVCEHTQLVAYGALAETLVSKARERIAAEIEALVVIVPIGQTPVEAKAQAYRSAARIARGEA